jgi:hypothetical protein
MVNGQWSKVKSYSPCPPCPLVPLVPLSPFPLRHPPTVYTQVELPPLIPPWKGGKLENLVPSPLQGEG